MDINLDHESSPPFTPPPPATSFGRMYQRLSGRPLLLAPQKLTLRLGILLFFFLVTAGIFIYLLNHPPTVSSSIDRHNSLLPLTK